MFVDLEVFGVWEEKNLLIKSKTRKGMISQNEASTNILSSNIT